MVLRLDGPQDGHLGPQGALQHIPGQHTVGRNGGNSRRCGVGNKGRRNGDSGNWANTPIRAPVLALCRAHGSAEAAAAARKLKTALLLATEQNAPIDGALLGMAAAHAGKFSLGDLLEALCDYAHCHLAQCGGREVAELTAAAVKHGRADARFLSAVAAFCTEGSPGQRFGCLRDAALMATALIHQPTLPPAGAGGAGGGAPHQPFDQASVFHGLAMAALPHLSAGGAPLRDCVEFLYSFAHILPLRPLGGGPPLCQVPVAEEVLRALFGTVCFQLHQSSSQDIAKIADAVATVSPLLPQIAEEVLQPCVVDLVQAVRFRYSGFNSQDLALTAVAFSKLDIVDARVSDILRHEIVARSSELSGKSLSLLLRAFARPGEGTSSFVTALVTEMQQRQLATFSVQDLCMTVQALARLGSTGKPLICLIAFEAHQRQLAEFTTANKAMLLWSLAKSKVFDAALCHLIVRSLCVESWATLPRDIISAALWALAVVWPMVTSEGYWPTRLAEALCTACPWRSAPPYEVANAAWAFGQLHESIPNTSWESLAAAVGALNAADLSLHELCNILSGFSIVPDGIKEGPGVVLRFAQEVARRCSAGEEFSSHDRRELSSALARASKHNASGHGSGDCHTLAELQALLKPSGPTATAKRCSEASAGKSMPSSDIEARPQAGPLKQEPAAWQVEASDLDVAGAFSGGECKSCEAGGDQKDHHHDHGHGDHHHDHGHSHHHHHHQQRARHQHVHHFHAHHHSDTHGEATVDERPGDAKAADAHTKHGIVGCEKECCPTIPGQGIATHLRINAHCTYHGHCVRLKNTFIHVECAGSDDDDDCVLCNLTRSRSSENIGRALAD